MSELDDAQRALGGRTPALKGWSGSNSYRLNSLDANPDNIGAFTVQAQFPSAVYYTVQFSFQANLDSSNEFAQTTDWGFRGIAKIHWTVAGNHHQRIVHVANGTTISGAGETVWVEFIDDTTPIGEEHNIVMAVTAVISIVPGTRANAAGSQPPMFADNEAVSVAAGATLDYSVPTEQGINSMLITATSAAVTHVELLGTDVTAISSFTPSLMHWGAVMFNRWAPIVPGTTQFTITNNTAAAVMFQVIWGVEG